MPSNFFTKLVKNAQAPQTPSRNVRTSSEEQGVTSPQTSTFDPSQTLPQSPPPHPSPYGDPAPSNSTGSVKIGVVPPSPHTTESDLSLHAIGYRPSIEQVHQASLQHRRVRSQDRERHIPNRHEVSLAARATSDITFLMDDTELTPTLGRTSQTPDWVSSHSTGSPRTSPRQLSPASSTGNLKGFVEMQSTRSHAGKFVEQKTSKRSIRSATQPPPPLNADQGTADTHSLIDVQQPAGRHEDTSVTVPNTVVDSPTSFASQKAQSQELLGAVSDGDTKSVRSATSSNHKNNARRQSGARKASGPASGAPMSNTPQVPPVPPLPPLPPPVAGSRSTLSVNGTTPKRGGDATRTRTRQPAPMRSPPRTRSPNVSLTRSDFSDGDTYSSGDESGSSSDGLDLDDRDIPVTGFAVASNRRNADFHELFPNIPEGDYLIEGEPHLFREATRP